MNQLIHKVYKIRNKETGLFSKGGNYGQDIWTKEVKSWSNIGHVKNHLNLFVDWKGNISSDYPYKNAELVEVEIKYDMCFTTDVNDILNIIINKKEQENKLLEDKRNKWNKEQELKQLAELKAKYENN